MPGSAELKACTTNLQLQHCILWPRSLAARDMDLVHIIALWLCFQPTATQQ